MGAAGASLTAEPAPTAPKAAKKTPEYVRDVAPILNRSCVPCHREGEVAPFSLVGYENAKKRASMIALVSDSRLMPPWKAVEGHGEFRDSLRLSKDEIGLLKAWADHKAPRGKGREPAPPPAKGEWPLGQPDLLLSPQKEITLGAEGEDEYRNIVLKTDFKETRYITAIDCKPGNRSIVHHVVVFLDEKGASHKLDERDTDGQEGYVSFGGPGFNPQGFLGAWAPGYAARLTEPGTAYELKPGATLVMQVHYHRSGKPERDLTKFGVYFAKEKPQSLLQMGIVVDPTIRIPAGEKAHRVTRTITAPQDMTVYTMLPHMHLLGRSMKADVTYPDGRTEPLIYIDDWDFNWQMQYAYKEPKRIPKGSKITVEAIYDNSASNPRNPNNPPKEVRFGEQTTDEMFVLVFAQTSNSGKPFYLFGSGR